MPSIRSWWQKLFGGPGPTTYYPGGLRPPVFFNCGKRPLKDIFDAIMEGTGGHIGPIGDMEFEVTTKDAIANYAQWWRRQQPPSTATFVNGLDGPPRQRCWFGRHTWAVMLITCMSRLRALKTRSCESIFIEPQSGYLEELAPEHFEGLVVDVFIVN